MKIKNISSKTFEFFKNNGKRIVCLATTGFVLATPCKARLEEYDNQLFNSPKDKIEEIMEDDAIVFVVSSQWKKTSNYSDGRGPGKENREYHRTVRRITTGENYNADYFKNNYHKILRFIEKGDFDKIFKVIDEKEEIILVDKKNENSIDKVNWYLEVEGTDIKEKMINPEILAEIMHTLSAATLCSLPLLLFAFLIAFDISMTKLRNALRNRGKRLYK